MQMSLAILLRQPITRLLATLALSFMPAPAAAFIYYATSIEARVVDAETGNGVQGAIVTANWQLEGGLESGIPVDQLKIMETVTDVNGKFTIPSWGPKFSFRGHASFKWPQILVFKRGYKYLRLSNEPRSGSQFTTSSDWNAKTIKLSPFGKDTAAYIRDFHALNSQLDQIATNGGDYCAWRRLPQVLRFVSREEIHIRAIGAKDFGSLVSNLKVNDAYFKTKGCDSPIEFIEGLESK